MPIFDYSCQACGHTFDILQKLGADPLSECPECGRNELKKLLSAPAFHLKGKGWKNSDDAPKKPDVRPKFAHTLDSATPHAEHDHDEPAKPAGHSHGHSHDHSHGHSHDHGEKKKGGMKDLVRKHVKKQTEGHSHGHSHDHGHSHGHKHGHKHDH
ncbi:MAG: FmdB family zinc ribbon protein [Gammaproteobacteria bacterium]